VGISNMAFIYSNGGPLNILGFNFTKRDALSSVYKISIIYRGRFGGILPEVMIFPEGIFAEGNIITEDNISTNPPSGGIILYFSINRVYKKKLNRYEFAI
jgi:hypothetical protein